MGLRYLCSHLCCLHTAIHISIVCVVFGTAIPTSPYIFGKCFSKNVWDSYIALGKASSFFLLKTSVMLVDVLLWNEVVCHRKRVMTVVWVIMVIVLEWNVTMDI